MDILDGKIIRSRRDLDETDDIQNNMDEISWQKGASFHVKMFVNIRSEQNLFPRASAGSTRQLLAASSAILTRKVKKTV